MLAQQIICALGRHLIIINNRALAAFAPQMPTLDGCLSAIISTVYPAPCTPMSAGNPNKPASPPPPDRTPACGGPAVRHWPTPPTERLLRRFRRRPTPAACAAASDRSRPSPSLASLRRAEVVATGLCVCCCHQYSGGSAPPPLSLSAVSILLVMCSPRFHCCSAVSRCKYR